MKGVRGQHQLSRTAGRPTTTHAVANVAPLALIQVTLERLDQIGHNRLAHIDLLIGARSLLRLHLDILLRRGGLLQVDGLGRQAGRTSGEGTGRKVEARGGVHARLESGGGSSDRGEGEVRDEGGKVRELVR